MIDGKQWRIGFKGKRQIPLLMIWYEIWEDGEVVDGHCIFSTYKYEFWRK